ncbi:MAG: hypothetical protein HOV87_04825 [Catenulispora sp.]|nr:hypothetical protein [Catenulispora sp.]
MLATHAVSATTVAMAGGRSWWNRPMAWGSLAAISYGGWLAARRGRRRQEREDAEYDQDTAPPPHPAVLARTAEDNPIDEAMNRLGRDWHPEASGAAGHSEESGA